VTQSSLSHMAHYLLELGRLPFAPTTCKPSLLAAAAVYLARASLNIRMEHPESSCDPNGIWTPSLEYYSGYSKNDLKDTVLTIHAYHLASESLTDLKATFAKYQSRKYLRVAIRTALPKEMLGFA
jgi:Cyclin, C-terminal domain